MFENAINGRCKRKNEQIRKIAKVPHKTSSVKGRIIERYGYRARIEEPSEARVTIEYKYLQDGDGLVGQGNEETNEQSAPEFEKIRSNGTGAKGPGS